MASHLSLVTWEAIAKNQKQNKRKQKQQPKPTRTATKTNKNSNKNQDTTHLCANGVRTIVDCVGPALGNLQRRQVMVRDVLRRCLGDGSLQPLCFFYRMFLLRLLSFLICVSAVCLYLVVPRRNTQRKMNEERETDTETQEKRKKGGKERERERNFMP